jgi:hypothetical protein
MPYYPCRATNYNGPELTPIKAAWLVLGIALFVVGPLDYSSSKVTAALVQEADHRKELPPEVLEDIGYWRRHEWNSQLCRGQTYIEQCCTAGRPELTCLNPENIR